MKNSYRKCIKTVAGLLALMILLTVTEPVGMANGNSSEPTRTEDSAGAPPSATADAVKLGQSFIRVSGDRLSDDSGSEFLIKSVAFGNDAHWNPSEPQRSTYHDEDAYGDISSLGFNTIRFNINYGLFEDDASPYVYKEEGFEWLDYNISLARGNNLKLIINMHCPQGGYQPDGDGKALWTDSDNQARLEALWREIASRYCDEPAILGYGLVNEPAPPSAAEWEALAQRLVNAIRKYDENHVIFAEGFYSSRLQPLDDGNLVYEYHLYSPHMYTHQGYPDTAYENAAVKYPEESYLTVSEDGRWVDCTAESGDGKYDLSRQGKWQLLSKTYSGADASRATFLRCGLQASYIGQSGIVYMDDIIIEEFDEKGESLGIIYSEGLDTQVPGRFWSDNGTGSCGRSMSEGYESPGAWFVKGTEGQAVLGDNQHLIAVGDGHSYKVSAWVKAVNLPPGASVCPRLDLYFSDQAYQFNRAYLQTLVEECKANGTAYNAPVFIGEFGVTADCFYDGRGGEQYVSDMLDILLENHIGFNYHAYSGWYFGIVSNRYANRNKALEKILTEKLTQ